MQRFWRDSDYATDPLAQRIFGGLLVLGCVSTVLTLVRGVLQTPWALQGAPLFGCAFWLTFQIRIARHEGQTLAYAFGALACMVAGGVVVTLVST